MQLFDLNIPYLETPNSKIQEKSSKKQTRLKQIVKSMELGYTGIAYNVTINGIMSDFHRSTISPFPLSSLLNLSPSLSSTVAFHRRILGVPLNAAFRQYTRLTIVVESSAQCSPLNSGNPVIKSYDIVAVRPLNQNCFDLACQSCQVDLISIDFSEKLPFRLKLPMVKAAIARGVYFEIMYSSLLQDVQVRRQMISNAKLLVDWTRGKNLIVSSAAPSVLELRGPNDVANLLSLLGLSNECAKATISKNCRLLVANVLRKKQFYKEAIRVEAMPPGVQTDPKEHWIVDHIDWDPLSSGEGDLVLDDIAKAFAESGKVFQEVKGTDMSDCVDAQSHGLQVNDIGLRTDEELCGSGNTTGTISTSEDFGFLKQSGDLENGFSSLCNSVLYQQGQPAKHCQQAILPVTTMASTNVEDFRFCSVGSQFELKTLDAPESATSPVKLLDLEMQNHIRIHSNNVLLCDSSKVIISGDGCNTGARNRVLEDTIERLNPSGAQTDDLKVGSGALINTDSGVSEEMQICVEADLSHSPNVSMAENLPELKADSVADGNSVAHAVNVMDVDPLMERNKSDGLSVDVQQLPEEMDKKKEYNEDYSVVITDAKETAVDAMMIKVSLQQENDSSSHSDETMMGCGKDVQENGNVEYQSLGEEKLGSPKLKRWDAGQVLRFPFKRLLQVQFKRKGRNLKCKTRKRE